MGKLYNVLAREIAEALVASLPSVAAARCYLSSQIGRPIDDPEIVLVELDTHAGAPAASLEDVERIVRDHPRHIALLSQRLVEGRVRLF